LIYTTFSSQPFTYWNPYPFPQHKHLAYHHPCQTWCHPGPLSRTGSHNHWNKWSKYTTTEGPLHDALNQRWNGDKLVTAHCRKTFFTSYGQPCGIAQMVLGQITGWVVARGRDELGPYAWQGILLDGTQKLLMITAHCFP
jgi:hypothetical protein